MDNLARVFSIEEYKNKMQLERQVAERNDGELSTEEMFRIMMKRMDKLEEQAESRKPKTNKKNKAEHTGVVEQKKEYSKNIIKNIDQIDLIRDTFLKNARGRYRVSNLKNRLYVSCQLYTALRCSDVLTLRFCDFLDELDLDNDIIKFKDKLVISEIKTREHNPNRHVFINKAIKDDILMYLNVNKNVKLDSYIFSSKSVNSKDEDSKPMSINAVNSMLDKVGKRAGLDFKITSHCLRRTSCYHLYMQNGQSNRTLHLIQSMLNHSSERQTLVYLGFDEEEQKEAYLNLNLQKGCKDDI